MTGGLWPPPLVFEYGWGAQTSGAPKLRLLSSETSLCGPDIGRPDAGSVCESGGSDVVDDNCSEEVDVQGIR